VRTIQLGSPLEFVFEIPWEAWAVGGSAFLGGLATLFGVPMKAAAEFEKARAEFWRSRLEADDAKRRWIESRRDRPPGRSFRLLDARTSESPPEHRSSAPEAEPGGTT
jgi:hypothetical protein